MERTGGGDCKIPKLFVLYVVQAICSVEFRALQESAIPRWGGAGKTFSGILVDFS